MNGRLAHGRVGTSFCGEDLTMKFSGVLCAMILAAGILSPAAQAQPAKVQPGNGSPYILTGTEVWDVPDPASKRVYQVFVSLPASYEKEPNRRYPVLYVTDAGYAFPVIREVSRRLNVEGPQI